MLEVSPQLSAAEREAKLAPYRSVIDKYVLRFSDEPLRYPASRASYGTRRRWMKLFIEQYVLNRGRLPDQELRIDVTVDGRGWYRGACTISAPSTRWHDYHAPRLDGSMLRPIPDAAGFEFQTATGFRSPKWARLRGLAAWSPELCRKFSRPH
jgi:hypothetical protein